ncbi:MAG TPA: pyridoxamine 5'-phosphate oxidase family protein [Egibacteraceae bacterium]
MITDAPRGEIAARFSSPGAQPAAWEDAVAVLRGAQIYWLSTVRDDGRPHVTPLIGVWHDDALWFCTGADERKARNLAANPRCVLTTGCNRLDGGLDVVVEGEAERVTDDARLRAVAAAYEDEYGPDWRFDVHDGVFVSPVGGDAIVFRVAPHTVFGFGKGDTHHQTRWRL